MGRKIVDKTTSYLCVHAEEMMVSHLVEYDEQVVEFSVEVAAYCDLFGDGGRGQIQIR